MRSHELRCFCRTRPLLGICGRDEAGRPYVHVKVFKQGRVYGELVATAGVVSVRCRDCGRWHRVDIRHTNVDFAHAPPPDFLKV